jgi:hypothetical protein
MFHYIPKCTADRLRELTGSMRLATLTCFLRQSYRDTIDQAVDMFDKIIIRMQADTERELDEQMCQQRKTIRVALSLLRTLAEIILDDDIDDVLRPKLFAVVPRDKLQWQAKEISRALKWAFRTAKISTSVSWSMSAPSNGRMSFFTASMCSTRRTFAN